MTKPALETMLPLSTSHVTETTCNGYLAYHRTGSYGRDTGYFVHTRTIEDDPADLVAVLAYARSLGCEWVLLDCDAAEVDALPVYSW